MKDQLCRATERPLKKQWYETLKMVISAVMVLMLLPLHGQGLLDHCSVLDRAASGNPKLSIGDRTNNTAVAAEDFVAVEYFSNRFFAVGTFGALVTSSDGDNWTATRSGVATLRAIAHGQQAETEKFCVVGDTGWVAMSNDGVTFLGVKPHKQNLRGVAFGNGKFVAVGALGEAYYQTDIADESAGWTNVFTGITNTLQGVVFNRGVFVANSDIDEVLTSFDGITWQRNRVPAPLTKIRTTSAGFIAIAANGRLAVSANGSVWNLLEPHNLGPLNDLATAAPDFVAVGNKAFLARSAAAVTWTTVAPPKAVSDRDFLGVARGAGLVVIVGNRGTLLATGSPTSPPVQKSLDILKDLTAVAYSAELGKYVGVGKSGASLNASANLRDWKARFPGTLNDLTAVTFGKGRFIAVGGNFTSTPGGHHATIVTSFDGDSWDAVYEETSIRNDDTGVEAYPISVAANDDRAIVLGTSGALLISEDAQNWRKVFVDVLTNCVSIGYYAGRFIAVGSAIVTSPDGTTWTQVTNAPPNLNLFSVTASPSGQFMAVGRGRSVTSFNGVDWFDGGIRSSTPLYQVIWGAAQFVAVGEGGAGLNSFDGVTWQRHALPSRYDLHGVVYGDREFIAVGDRGNIVFSTKVDPEIGRPAPVYWAQQIGGDDTDSVVSISTDPNCAYLVGGGYRDSVRIGSTTLRPNPDDLTSISSAFYVARYRDISTPFWARSGPPGSSLRKVISTSTSDVLLAGHAPGGLDLEGAQVLTTDGLGFISQWRASGDPTWIIRFDGVASDIAPGFGNNRAVGSFKNAISFGEAAAYPFTNELSRLFVIALGVEGTNNWLRWIQASNGTPSQVVKVSTDPFGNAFVLGASSGGLQFYQPPPPPPDPPPNPPAGETPPDPAPAEEPMPVLVRTIPGDTKTTSLFLAYYDDKGSNKWAKYFGNGGDQPVAAARDGTNGVVVAANSPDGMMLARFDMNSRQLWTRRYTPGGGAQITAMSTSPNGHIFVTGNFQGVARFDNLSLTNSSTATFILHLTPLGKLLTAQVDGKSESPNGFSAPLSIAVNDSDEFVIGGIFTSRVNIDGKGFVSNGAQDGYIAVVKALPNPPPPPIQITKTPTGVKIEFPLGCRLQSSPILPVFVWSDVNKNSPVNVDPAEGQQFYRIVSE